MRKCLKSLTILEKLHDWVLKTPLEGFVQDAPREKLAIAPV